MSKVNLEKFLERQRGSTITNYVIPGLESLLLQGAQVRFFRMTREQVTMITPHNHRFDFACLVLEGRVRNTIFSGHPDGDSYMVHHITPKNGGLGEYAQANWSDYESCFKAVSSEYKKGDWYFMAHTQYHSIQFSRDAFVMFIEGAQETSDSKVLLPVVGGQVIDIFKTEPWMFLKP